MTVPLRASEESSSKSLLSVGLTLQSQLRSAKSASRTVRAAKLWPFRKACRTADIQQPCRDRRQIVYDLHINSTGRIIYLCNICFKERNENLAIVSRNRGTLAMNYLTHRPPHDDRQSLCTHLAPFLIPSFSLIIE